MQVYCHFVTFIIVMAAGNITSVSDGLRLTSDADRTILAGLDNTASVGINLEISGNAALTSLEGQGNLISVGYVGQYWYRPADITIAGLRRLSG